MGLEMGKKSDETKGDTFNSLKTVTPLSKYLAMTLFVILPFVGGYIGYVYAKNSTQLVIIENTVPEKVDETKGWKTYRSEEFGFEFKHPADWYVNDRSYRRQGMYKKSVVVSAPNTRYDLPRLREQGYEKATFQVHFSGEKGEEIALQEMSFVGTFIDDRYYDRVELEEDFITSQPEYRIGELIVSTIKNFQPVLSSEEISLLERTADWETYISNEHRNFIYRVRHPKNRIVASQPDQLKTTFSNQTDSPWSISIVDTAVTRNDFHPEYETVLEEPQGSGLENDEYEWLEIDFGEIYGERIVTTNDSLPDFYSETIKISLGRDIYMITNGGVYDPLFEDFYKTLEFQEVTQ